MLTDSSLTIEICYSWIEAKEVRLIFKARVKYLDENSLAGALQLAPFPVRGQLEGQTMDSGEQDSRLKSR